MSPKYLWIDDVGGFVFVTKPRVSIGQAVPGNEVDLLVRGDLARVAGWISRIGEDCFLGRTSSPQVELEPDWEFLRNSEQFRLGNVTFQYERRLSHSLTARLDILGPAGWHNSLQGALLVSENCLIGNFPQAHVRCPDFEGGIILFRESESWFARQLGDDCVPDLRSAPTPLKVGQRVQLEDYSFCLE